MDNNYWSLEAILAEENVSALQVNLLLSVSNIIITQHSHHLKLKRFECTFSSLQVSHRELNSLGMIEVEKDLQIDLPFWLAQDLAQEEYISLSIPTMFQDKVLDELKASSIAVNLSQHSLYFYSFASMIINVMQMSPNFSNLLTSAFRDRLILVNNYSQKSNAGLDSSKFLMFLDESEKECKSFFFIVEGVSDLLMPLDAHYFSIPFGCKLFQKPSAMEIKETSPDSTFKRNVGKQFINSSWE